MNWDIGWPDSASYHQNSGFFQQLAIHFSDGRQALFRDRADYRTIEENHFTRTNQSLEDKYMKRVLFSGLSVLALSMLAIAPVEASTQSPTRFNDGRAVETVELTKSTSEGPTRFSDGRATEGPTRFNDGRASEGPTRFNDGRLVDSSLLKGRTSEGPTRFNDGQAAEGPTRFNDGRVSEGPTRFNDGRLSEAVK